MFKKRDLVNFFKKIIWSNLNIYRDGKWKKFLYKKDVETTLCVSGREINFEAAERIQNFKKEDEKNLAGTDSNETKFEYPMKQIETEIY